MKFPTFLKDPTASAASAGTSKQPAKAEPASEDDSSDSSSSSSEGSTDEMPTLPSIKISTPKKDSDATANTAEASGETGNAESTPSSPARPGSARPKSSGSMRNLTIKIPPPLTPAEKVHPLEVLYKKRKSGENANETAGAAEAFSFFGGDAEGDAGDSQRSNGPAKASLPPMTPYTSQDFEWRNVRSAAPTPDTAHPSKRVFWAPDGDNDVDEEEEEEDDDDKEALGASDDKTESKEQAPDSDFKKAFYEKRRELGRSWVERRKMAQQEKKTRERKLRSSRA
jgi:hypothetical protein